MTVDDMITKITEAPTEQAAKAIMQSVPRRIVLQMADQLHIDMWGHGTVWTINEVIKEARS